MQIPNAVVFPTIFLLCLFLPRGATQELKNRNSLIMVETDDDNDDTTIEVLNGNGVENEKYEAFHPTDKWQEIKPGQAIPAGLHVRMDLQSGKKEAKFLDDSKPSEQNMLKGRNDFKKYNYWETENVRKGIINKESSRFNVEELREALKSFKADEYEEKSVQDIKRIREKFRSIDELKKEFSAINLNIKSDTEILGGQLEKYLIADDNEKINILHDLEYLVHQYDVAQDFVKMGGINRLLPDLNSTDSKIRSLVAFTFGSAMQGNPRVQIAVLETSVMQHLLRLVAFDPSPEVQARSLFALSSLLRHFPLAQQKFIGNGGFTALADIFKHSKASSFKLQLKVVTLLHDLISEQHLAEKHAKAEDIIQQEKLRQYQSFHLEEALTENGFCLFLPKLLGAPDYDSQEKVINAMLSIVHICHDSFSTSLEKLHHLAKDYKLAAVQDADVTAPANNQRIVDEKDSYFASLYNLITNLIIRVEQSHRDEL